MTPTICSCAAVKPDSFADHSTVRSKIFLPRAKAQNRNVVASLLLFARKKCAPQHRLYAKNLEEIAGGAHRFEGDRTIGGRVDGYLSEIQVAGERLKGLQLHRLVLVVGPGCGMRKSACG